MQKGRERRLPARCASAIQKAARGEAKRCVSGAQLLVQLWRMVQDREHTRSV
jgi:hypothetical protein